MTHITLRRMPQGMHGSRQQLLASFAQTERITLTQLAEEISAECTLTAADIMGCIEALTAAVARHVSRGHSVSLGNLGTVSATLKVETEPAKPKPTQPKATTELASPHTTQLEASSTHASTNAAQPEASLEPASTHTAQPEVSFTHTSTNAAQLEASFTHTSTNTAQPEASPEAVHVRSVHLSRITFRPSPQLRQKVEAALQREVVRPQRAVPQAAPKTTRTERLRLLQDYLRQWSAISVRQYAALAGISRYRASQELSAWQNTPDNHIGVAGFGTHRMTVWADRGT